MMEPDGPDGTETIAATHDDGQQDSAELLVQLGLITGTPLALERFLAPLGIEQLRSLADAAKLLSKGVEEHLL